MGICPEHGQFNEMCRKCQGAEEKKWEKELNPPTAPFDKTDEWEARVDRGRQRVTDIDGKEVYPDPPTLSDADKYLLKSFENDALNARIEAQDAAGRFQETTAELSRQMQTLFQRLSIDPSDWVLDFRKMVFVRREK